MPLYPLSNDTIYPHIDNPTGTERLYGMVDSTPDTNGHFLFSDFANSAIIVDTPTSVQNNYAPSGYKTGPWPRQTIVLAGTTACGVTGLQGGVAGKQVTIRNVGDTLRWLVHEAASSTDVNRFSIPGGFALLMPGDSITFEWGRANDAPDNRWNVVNWPNRGMGMGLSLFDDFHTIGASVIGGAANGASSSASTYTASGVDTTQRTVGAVRLDTGTSSAGRAALGTTSVAQGSALIYPGAGAMLSVCRMLRNTAPDGTEDFNLLSGFTNTHNGLWNDNTTARNAMAWENRYNGSAEAWNTIVIDNKSADADYTTGRSTTGAPASATVSNNYFWWLVYVDSAWANVDFIYGDAGVFTLAARRSTGLPSGSNGVSWTPAYLQKRAGTTSRSAFVDLAGFRGNFGVRG